MTAALALKPDTAESHIFTIEPAATPFGRGHQAVCSCGAPRSRAHISRAKAVAEAYRTAH